MIRFVADHNFSERIVRGVQRANPAVEITLLRDADLSDAKDPVVLEWAARKGLITLSHDVNTMVASAIERVDSGKPMPGLFVAPQAAPIGAIVADILLLAECGREGEWEGQVLFLPLR